MITKKQNGQYKVSVEENSDSSKSTEKTVEKGVIRGDVANETETGAFRRQFGFKSSKWYAYTLTKTTVIPSLDFSPTAPRRAFKKRFLEVEFVQKEFNTKKEAVGFFQD